MRFGKTLNDNFNLEIEGNVIEQVKEFRFLGIRHNDKLDISPQLSHTKGANKFHYIEKVIKFIMF